MTLIAAVPVAPSISVAGDLLDLRGPARLLPKEAGQGRYCPAMGQLPGTLGAGGC